MPSLDLGGQPGVAWTIEYTAGNGRASGLTCANGSGVPVWGEAVLADGRRVGQAFPVGTTSVNLPSNAVQVALDARGDAIFTGLASFNSRTL